MGKNKTIFVIKTPVPASPTVTCYQHTWYGHVLKRHPEVDGHLHDVKTVVAEPSYVFLDPGTRLRPAQSYIFVNTTVKNFYGSPLAVVVDPDQLFVRTAHYDQSLINPELKIIWPGTNDGAE